MPFSLAPNPSCKSAMLLVPKLYLGTVALFPATPLPRRYRPLNSDLRLLTSVFRPLTSPRSVFYFLLSTFYFSFRIARPRPAPLFCEGCALPFRPTPIPS
jgi:hypothetical protein